MLIDTTNGTLSTLSYRFVLRAALLAAGRGEESEARGLDGMLSTLACDVDRETDDLASALASMARTSEQALGDLARGRFRHDWISSSAAQSAETHGKVAARLARQFEDGFFESFGYFFSGAFAAIRANVEVPQEAYLRYDQLAYNRALVESAAGVLRLASAFAEEERARVEKERLGLTEREAASHAKYERVVAKRAGAHA